MLATILIESDQESPSPLLTSREEVPQYKIMDNLPISMDHWVSVRGWEHRGVNKVNMEQLEETHKMKIPFKVFNDKHV